MAVFPDRIVHKNSTDDQATIEGLIGAGGDDEITPGELVVGRESGTVKFYALDADNNVAVLGTASTTLGSLTDTDVADTSAGTVLHKYLALDDNDDLWKVSALPGGAYTFSTPSAPTTRPDGLPLQDGDMWFNTSDGSLSTRFSSAWVQVTSNGAGVVDGDKGDIIVSGGGVIWDIEDGVVTSAKLSDTGVVPGSYTAASITVDSAGRVTAASTGSTDGSGIGAAGAYVSETQVASSGEASFTGLGHSGILRTVSSDLAAWIVLYGSAADRTYDVSRSYAIDPAPGSGVLAEVYVEAGGTVLATPGTSYFNNDLTPQDTIYVAVRDQAGGSVDASVTITGYGQTTITAISGGGFGSG